ncbi:MAG: hypothetical protein R6U26_00725 [Candidatus Undinarchaeales archaeon]
MRSKKPACHFCGSKKVVVLETEHPENRHPGDKRWSEVSLIDILRWVNDEKKKVDGKDISRLVPDFVKNWMRIGVKFELCPECKRIAISPMKQKRL